MRKDSRQPEKSDPQTLSFLCNAEGDVLGVSPSADERLPGNNGDRLPDRLAPFVEPQDGQPLADALNHGLADDSETELPARLDDCPVTLRIVPLGGENRLVSIDETCPRTDHSDSLTGLPDRSAMIEHIREIQESGRNGYRLLLADIDRLKTVNDYLGNHVGDHLIRELADGLRRTLPGDAVIARWSGHEFMLLIPPEPARDMDRLTEQVRLIASGIRLSHASDIPRLGSVTVSIGHAALETGNVSRLVGSDSLSAINAAVYEAKRTGRDRAVDADHLREPSVYATGGALDRAIHEGRIVAASQPIVDLKTGEVVADETLARMLTPDGEVIPAGRFIEAAARLQMAHRIDYEIIHQTIANCVSTIGHRPMAHFVNISGDFLHHPELMEEIIATAQSACSCEDQYGDNGVKPLVLEMTEREVLDDTSHAVEALKPLIDFGLRLALDDFGSGYSSYRYLLDMPFTFLKIEGALVQHIHDNTRARKIVQHIQSMAADLGLTTVAEFIADQRTADMLREMGLDWGQGFHFGHPEIVRPIDLSGDRRSRHG
ncbi:MAG: EAL domain-containing protein [Pseudomonadota bacterium]